MQDSIFDIVGDISVQRSGGLIQAWGGIIGLWSSAFSAVGNVTASENVNGISCIELLLSDGSTDVQTPFMRENTFFADCNVVHKSIGQARLVFFLLPVYNATFLGKMEITATGRVDARVASAVEIKGQYVGASRTFFFEPVIDVDAHVVGDDEAYGIYFDSNIVYDINFNSPKFSVAGSITGGSEAVGIDMFAQGDLTWTDGSGVLTVSSEIESMSGNAIGISFRGFLSAFIERLSLEVSGSITANIGYGVGIEVRNDQTWIGAIEEDSTFLLTEQAEISAKFAYGLWLDLSFNLVENVHGEVRGTVTGSERAVGISLATYGAENVFPSNFSTFTLEMTETSHVKGTMIEKPEPVLGGGRPYLPDGGPFYVVGILVSEDEDLRSMPFFDAISCKVSGTLQGPSAYGVYFGLSTPVVELTALELVFTGDVALGDVSGMPHPMGIVFLGTPQNPSKGFSIVSLPWDYAGDTVPAIHLDLPSPTICGGRFVGGQSGPEAISFQYNHSDYELEDVEFFGVNGVSLPLLEQSTMSEFTKTWRDVMVVGEISPTGTSTRWVGGPQSAWCRVSLIHTAMSPPFEGFENFDFCGVDLISSNQTFNLPNSGSSTAVLSSARTTAGGLPAPFGDTCGNLIDDGYLKSPPSPCMNVSICNPAVFEGCDMRVCNRNEGILQDCVWQGNGDDPCVLDLDFRLEIVRNVVFGMGCDVLTVSGDLDDADMTGVVFQAFESVIFDDFFWNGKGDITIKTRPRRLIPLARPYSVELHNFRLLNGASKVTINIDAKMDPYVPEGIVAAFPWFVKLEGVLIDGVGILAINLDVVGKVVLEDLSHDPTGGGVVLIKDCSFKGPVILRGEIDGEVLLGTGTGNSTASGLVIAESIFEAGFGDPVLEADQTKLNIDIDIARHGDMATLAYGFHMYDTEISGYAHWTLAVSGTIRGQTAHGATVGNFQVSGALSHFEISTKGWLGASSGTGVQFAYPTMDSTDEISVLMLVNEMKMLCSNDCIGISTTQSSDEGFFFLFFFKFINSNY